MKQDLVLVFWHEESQMEVQVVQEVQPPSTGLNTLVHSVHVVSEVSVGPDHLPYTDLWSWPPHVSVGSPAHL